MRTLSDRGAVGLALLAPVLAAVIGGAAAVGAAVQLVHLAPGQSSSSQVSTSAVDYGNR